MAKYRFLQDHYIGNLYFSAGTTASTSDVGGLLPANWVPTPNVDPLDTPAVEAFYAAGPNKIVPQPGPCLFATYAPATYWVWAAVPGNSSVLKFSLTGLGAGLSPVFYGNGTGGHG
jgi:hypothetical protein